MDKNDFIFTIGQEVEVVDREEAYETNRTLFQALGLRDPDIRHPLLKNGTKVEIVSRIKYSGWNVYGIEDEFGNQGAICEAGLDQIDVYGLEEEMDVVPMSVEMLEELFSRADESMQSKLAEAYPAIFTPKRKPFEFGESYNLSPAFRGGPIAIGNGIVDHEDRLKCIIVNTLDYEVHVEEENSSTMVVKFFAKK